MSDTTIQIIADVAWAVILITGAIGAVVVLRETLLLIIDIASRWRWAKLARRRPYLTRD
jgi:hypothetical protein